MQFEFRYIDVKWRKEGEVKNFETSGSPLPITKDGDRLLVETGTYSEFFYLGLHIKDGNPKHTPYFLLNKQKKEELMPIVDPGTNKKWWVEKGKWNNKNLRYANNKPRWNTAGRLLLYAEEKRITIENHPANFTLEDLEYCLKDFKDGLWKLIVDNESVATAKVEQNIPSWLSKELERFLKNYVQNLTKLIAAPNIFLQESEAKMPVREVKPTRRTFQEFAINPSAEVFSSRISSESYDTAENRYIHHCVLKLIALVKGFIKISETQFDLSDKQLEYIKKRRSELKNTSEQKIDEDLYKNEIATLASQLEQINEDFRANLVQKPKDSGCVEISNQPCYIKLGDQYAERKDKFFNKLYQDQYTKIEGNTIKREKGLPPPKGEFFTIEFPIKNSIDNKETLLYEVFGICKLLSDRTNTYKEYKNLKFYEIFPESKIFDIELEGLKKKQVELERTNWSKSTGGNCQQDNGTSDERNALEKQHKNLDDLRGGIEEIKNNLEPILKNLNKAKCFFDKHQVKIKTTCPNSMVFIQNPLYAQSKKLYSKIIKASNTNENTLDYLLGIDSINLVVIPDLYEKWCLIQIIKVLKDTLKFSLQGDWKKELIQVVSDKEKSVELIFKHHIASEPADRLVFSYQKKLPSGKKPDFVLDFEGCNISKRLVIDAKLRSPEETEEKLNRELEDLYNGKNYSEDGENQVFILHPVAESVETKTSPLPWGRDCNYGQANEQKHQRGLIFLSPAREHFSSITNLHRLIVLFWQKHNSLNKVQKGEERSVICMGCGSEAVAKSKETSGGNIKWTIECSKCGLITVQTICFKCKKPLFKNMHLTYHRTRAEEVFNVVCPYCESFFPPTERDVKQIIQTLIERENGVSKTEDLNKMDDSSRTEDFGKTEDLSKKDDQSRLLF